MRLFSIVAFLLAVVPCLGQPSLFVIPRNILVRASKMGDFVTTDGAMITSSTPGVRFRVVRWTPSVRHESK
jgi:hypothetical protein